MFINAIERLVRIDRKKLSLGKAFNLRDHVIGNNLNGQT